MGNSSTGALDPTLKFRSAAGFAADQEIRGPTTSFALSPVRSPPPPASLYTSPLTVGPSCLLCQGASSSHLRFIGCLSLSPSLSVEGCFARTSVRRRTLE